MSGRIAHRPRYRSMRQLIPPSLRSHQSFFRDRWTYRRRQETLYERHPLGYGLSLIPVTYHLVPTLALPRS
jgi:hypothetical protein